MAPWLETLWGRKPVGTSEPRFAAHLKAIPRGIRGNFAGFGGHRISGTESPGYSETEKSRRQDECDLVETVVGDYVVGVTQFDSPVGVVDWLLSQFWSESTG
jgi:hypothetical protein